MASAADADDYEDEYFDEYDDEEFDMEPAEAAGHKAGGGGAVKAYDEGAMVTLASVAGFTAESIVPIPVSTEGNESQAGSKRFMPKPPAKPPAGVSYTFEPFQEILSLQPSNAYAYVQERIRKGVLRQAFAQAPEKADAEVQVEPPAATAVSVQAPDDLVTIAASAVAALSAAGSSKSGSKSGSSSSSAEKALQKQLEAEQRAMEGRAALVFKEQRFQLLMRKAGSLFERLISVNNLSAGRGAAAESKGKASSGMEGRLVAARTPFDKSRMQQFALANTSPSAALLSSPSAAAQLQSLLQVPLLKHRRCRMAALSPHRNTVFAVCLGPQQLGEGSSPRGSSQSASSERVDHLYASAHVIACFEDSLLKQCCLCWSAPCSLSFSSDGHLILAGSEEGLLYVWNLREPYWLHPTVYGSGSSRSSSSASAARRSSESKEVEGKESEAGSSRSSTAGAGSKPLHCPSGLRIPSCYMVMQASSSSSGSGSSGSSSELSYRRGRGGMDAAGGGSDGFLSHLGSLPAKEATAVIHISPAEARKKPYTGQEKAVAPAAPQAAGSAAGRGAEEPLESSKDLAASLAALQLAQQKQQQRSSSALRLRRPEPGAGLGSLLLHRPSTLLSSSSSADLSSTASSSSAAGLSSPTGTAGSMGQLSAQQQQRSFVIVNEAGDVEVVAVAAVSTAGDGSSVGGPGVGAASLQRAWEGSAAGGRGAEGGGGASDGSNAGPSSSSARLLSALITETDLARAVTGTLRCVRVSQASSSQLVSSASSRLQQELLDSAGGDEGAYAGGGYGSSAGGRGGDIFSSSSSAAALFSTSTSASSFSQLAGFLAHAAGLQAAAADSCPSDPSHLLLAAADGSIHHVSRYSDFPSPSVFQLREAASEGRKAGSAAAGRSAGSSESKTSDGPSPAFSLSSSFSASCTCLQYHPALSSFFLAGYSEGTVALFSTAHKEPLRSWSSPWAAVDGAASSLLRPGHGAVGAGAAASAASSLSPSAGKQKLVSSILKVAWLPTRPCCFLAVDRDGWMAVWDLALDEHRPVYVASLHELAGACRPSQLTVPATAAGTAGAASSSYAEVAAKPGASGTPLSSSTPLLGVDVAGGMGLSMEQVTVQAAFADTLLSLPLSPAFAAPLENELALAARVFSTLR